MKSVKKVVLAYSGGLDTSVMVRWLIETYGCKVVCFIADLGQGEDMEEIREKAIETGASKAVVKDLRMEFVKHYVFPMLRANAVYEGSYLLGTSIARPLIAAEQVRLANQINADAVSHGSTGKGNDQVRFELAYQALRPDIQIVVPWREWNLTSRSALIRYAKKNDIPILVSRAKPYSIDRNMFHTSYEGGILEDPWKEPPESLFQLTRSVENTPKRPKVIEIEYKKGNPVSLNGNKMNPVQMLQACNELGGRYGIGRVDIIENRYVGMKSRGVYETPGGTILHVAHRALESLTMDREVMRIRDSLIPKYSELIYYGYWFSPERKMLQALIDDSQETVSGTVRLKLFRGICTVTGRKAKRSLYDPQLATFEEGSEYKQSEAEGFIQLLGLRLRMWAKLYS